MGRIDENPHPTLCLKIQDPAHVAQGIRFLRGEERLGIIRCIQLYVVFFRLHCFVGCFLHEFKLTINVLVRMYYLLSVCYDDES